MTMEKISEAILEKVKAETDQIVKEAEVRAQERIESAKARQQERFDEEKAKLLSEANNEAAKIKAQASISIRLDLLKVKNEVIDAIVSKIKTNLAAHSANVEALVHLVQEGIAAVDSDEVVVYAAKSDIDKVKDAVKKDNELSDRVKDVREMDFTGGVIVEDSEGKIRIDDTFETRLETLLPRVLPDISMELFGS